MRDLIPGFPLLSEKLLGLTSKRKLPRFASQPFLAQEATQKNVGSEVVLFSDSFNSYFEPNILSSGIFLITCTMILNSFFVNY